MNSSLLVSGVLILAYILDLILGDPGYRLHPIRLAGHFISNLEKGLRSVGLDGRGGGIVLVTLTELVTVGSCLFICIALYELFVPAMVAFCVFMCYSCLALRDLADHVRPVIKSLETGDLRKARQAVSMVVGRDVNYLDEQGVCRAAIETLAENFVDGFLSPVFWYVAGAVSGSGLGANPLITAVCFMMGFKTASTLDSMVGYKDDKYREFGWAGARLDDILNFIPARLSGLILAAGAVVTCLNAGRGLGIFKRDRLKHDSPNAAHAESFVAGALGVRLGGPARYPGGLKDKPWLGKEFCDPGPAHIRKVVSLLHVSGWISILMFGGMCFLIK